MIVTFYGTEKSKHFTSMGKVLVMLL